MKPKTYKALWLTEELANKIKVRATKRKQTIIQFVEEFIIKSKN